MQVYLVSCLAESGISVALALRVSRVAGRAEIIRDRLLRSTYTTSNNPCIDEKSSLGYYRCPV